jgi:hypothetical protein
MRRTLALAGAAVLVVGVSALPTPASADPLLPDVVINEIAAELNPSSSLHDFEGGFIELINNSSSLVELEGYLLQACDSDGNLTQVVSFGLDHEIAANGGTFVIADPSFDGSLEFVTPNLSFSTTGILLQEGGGVLLEETSTDEVDTVQWGSPPNDCQGFNDVGVDPDDDKSINRGSPWFKAAPTPEPAS